VCIPARITPFQTFSAQAINIRLSRGIQEVHFSSHEIAGSNSALGFGICVCLSVVLLWERSDDDQIPHPSCLTIIIYKTSTLQGTNARFGAVETRQRRKWMFCEFNQSGTFPSNNQLGGSDSDPARSFIRSSSSTRGIHSLKSSNNGPDAVVLISTPIQPSFLYSELPIPSSLCVWHVALQYQLAN
jgi:hypothetical protein